MDGDVEFVIPVWLWPAWYWYQFKRFIVWADGTGERVERPEGW